MRWVCLSGHLTVALSWLVVYASRAYKGTRDAYTTNISPQAVHVWAMDGGRARGGFVYQVISHGLKSAGVFCL